MKETMQGFANLLVAAATSVVMILVAFLVSGVALVWFIESYFGPEGVTLAMGYALEVLRWLKVMAYNLPMVLTACVVWFLVSRTVTTTSQTNSNFTQDVTDTVAGILSSVFKINEQTARTTLEATKSFGGAFKEEARADARIWEAEEKAKIRWSVQRAKELEKKLKEEELWGSQAQRSIPTMDELFSGNDIRDHDDDDEIVVSPVKGNASFRFLE